MLPDLTSSVLTLAMLAAAAVLPGQTLYLLRGGISDRPQGPWASQIIKVDEKAGRLALVRDLEVDKLGAISTCLVNYEHRLIVFSIDTNSYLVLEMDNVQSPFLLHPALDQPLPVPWMSFNEFPKPPLPRPTRLSAVARDFLFRADLGFALRLELWGPNGVAGYALPIWRGPSQRPGRALSPDDWRGFVSSGTVGIGRATQGSGHAVSPDEPNLRMLLPYETIDLGIPSPPIVLTAGGKLKSFGLETNSRQSMMVWGRDESNATKDRTSLYVLDKTKLRWRVVNVPGDSPIVKSIGEYLLGIARSLERRGRQNAGQAEFERKTPVQLRFPHYAPLSEPYYTGILFAINVDTGKMLQWRTNQADSEIVWADDSAFYYRRLNELLKVNLIRGPSGVRLGRPISILKADVLLDVHVAFRGK